ncbi:dihydroneopterin aldolase family protein [Halodesulfurarchaeum sp.]|uniref:dihydroneopterin aldolase family protein n=1 Tax=Halodesulfurarchaeum sp. TaxID=1980530 RepID=UPI001BBBBF9D|nr:dihydroneopterin aldolase family protein [Halodesulfurarchaeum sp.]
MPTDGEQASFELGIKFGALFHQFIGTPVSESSAKSLETAIEESIENQPHCESVAVTIDREVLAGDVGPYGYTGLAGRHLNVDVVVSKDGRRAEGSMQMVDGYPLMTLDAVE